MKHWCDYRNFAESLEWLADQDNEKIEQLVYGVSQRGSDHVDFYGTIRPAVCEPLKDAGVEMISQCPS